MNLDTTPDVRILPVALIPLWLELSDFERRIVCLSHRGWALRRMAEQLKCAKSLPLRTWMVIKRKAEAMGLNLTIRGKYDPAFGLVCNVEDRETFNSAYRRALKRFAEGGE